MDRQNIVLTGFMGTGKASVGHVLAQLLGREFVDMDARIQAQAGMTVAQIFAQRGESYFRSLERALVRELAASDNLVIATGGGALVNPENRAAFANAHVICLDASVDEISARLNGTADRPLLASNGQDPPDDYRRARIEELLAARREAYDAIRIHVSTDGLTPAGVAQAIKRRLGTYELWVRTPAERASDRAGYSIFLGKGLLEHVGEFLRDYRFASRCAVVTNPTIGALYADRVCASLRAQDFSPTLITIPDGEQHKNLDTVRSLYDQFIAAHLERHSPVLALGGGVLGDTVGMAAATYLRGVPFVQLPTTLLAIVDSSIGGKVAVDHPQGKNLIGAFKFPACVIADLAVLETLPHAEFRAGIAEVIKHGVIGDVELFRSLERGEWNRTTGLSPALVERALRVKIEIVERDPFEQELRAHLNLGHTFGQAIERLGEYQMRHGYAVAMGLAAAARLAANIGFCADRTRDEILNLLERYELPTHLPRAFSPAQILDAMGTDKKIRDGKLRLVLPHAIGHVEIAQDVAREEIERALTESYPV